MTPVYDQFLLFLLQQAYSTRDEVPKLATSYIEQQCRIFDTTALVNMV